MDNLSINQTEFNFSELLTTNGLKKLDTTFLTFLKEKDEMVYEQLLCYRKKEPKFLKLKSTSELIIACGIILESFIADLFLIKTQVDRLRLTTLRENIIFDFKKFYILRQAKRLLKKSDLIEDFSLLDQWVNTQLEKSRLDMSDREWAIACWGQDLLKAPKDNANFIEKLILWCVAALTQSEGKKAVKGWESFYLPKYLDYDNLVKTIAIAKDNIKRLEGPTELHRYRDGFTLTDSRMNRRQVMHHINYCIYCHKTNSDFCSKGFPVKKSDSHQKMKINPLGEILTGCPLDEKISEMHFLKKKGYAIAALATIMIDNPMCPATGHRICNDCMKACIYQKQEPVDIPQTETRVLTDVLELPWGVEIYDLLTRWNPLRQKQYLPKTYNGKKVLIVGMGPAGFTLAHFLLMEGFAVVGVDGLKIEPLPSKLVTEPILHYIDLQEQLDIRTITGFGGVAEYGITSRWDKNFLKLIYISLLRRPYFQVFGGIRFGGTLLIEDAWHLGLDHLAIAVGAGLSRELNIPHSLAPGMRQANDFLMALQLTGTAKSSSLANLQIRLPAVVIGGGLTAIDTATEVQAYYIAQVEKVIQRYKKLIAHFGEEILRSRFDTVSLEILDEFLNHGKVVGEERQKAKEENRPVNFMKLIRKWGGVTVVYRRTMKESSAYKRNYNEIIKALEEGIYYVENLEPKSVQTDNNGLAMDLVCKRCIASDEISDMTDKEQVLPARSIFVATGARPNIAYAYEHNNALSREGFNYKRFELKAHQLKEVTESSHCKITNFGPFTDYNMNGYFVSFLGDTHPIFHGSVVKAIASAKKTYPKIVKALQCDNQGDEIEYKKFRNRIATLFEAKIVTVQRHSPTLVECQIRAPMAARNFKAGQFYRLQNFEYLSPLVNGTRLQTEALAVISANRCISDPDVMGFMILERGASSRLIATLQPGQPISIMGPTGCYSKILKDGSKKNIMVVGGFLAAVYLRSLGPVLRRSGHRVFYIALVEEVKEFNYCQEELESISNVIFWILKTTNGETIKLKRLQDRVIRGGVSSFLRFCMTEILPISLYDIDLVYIIDSTDLLKQIQKGLQGSWRKYFKPEAEFFAAVYGPMQCMMKGVCAQCLQWQIDPRTGWRTKAVYSCSWQHQPIELVDIKNIEERLFQNRTQEILSNLWLDYLFSTEKIERV
ncbi:FAD-dependent oxidoreductase [Coxiella endosymbiont of Amblyomma americanum]|uniref:FAD-dependent oxidoreductase n=1 Tax=Coxiella endosymbiont of Amblyomma americanum TaxID=325775 RepID=UPI00057C84F0|nr:FAD-dependent oxidoreductase [Coxiella endosymbiont of Amblyomma americanum]AJC50631.1 pyridine nucleotide-disulfide oxidoreductase [Coxiella endosymbiont of Amblyomma americanum]AUJ58960.1 pyridine nucleotide-disulfide oxidoreductase [Coxiella-like endosymbiont of Amblyomma americanum]